MSQELYGRSPAMVAVAELLRAQADEVVHVAVDNIDHNAAMRYGLEHGFPPSRPSTWRERFRDNLAAGLFWLGERLITLATRVST